MNNNCIVNHEQCNEKQKTFYFILFYFRAQQQLFRAQQQLVRAQQQVHSCASAAALPKLCFRLKKKLLSQVEV